MSQVYHSNAKLNQHPREIIQKSVLKNVELDRRFTLNEKTILKWKRTLTLSMRQKNILLLCYQIMSKLFLLCYRSLLRFYVIKN